MRELMKKLILYLYAKLNRDDILIDKLNSTEKSDKSNLKWHIELKFFVQKELRHNSEDFKKREMVSI